MVTGKPVVETIILVIILSRRLLVASTSAIGHRYSTMKMAGVPPASTVLCAGDEPYSVTVSARRVRSAIRCASLCGGDLRCRAINHRTDDVTTVVTSSCHLFDHVPLNFSVVAGCRASLKVSKVLFSYVFRCFLFRFHLNSLSKMTQC